jgi:hypothetical protein
VDQPSYVVDFPTLGFLQSDWVKRHCIVPDGFRKGRPFEDSDWQLWCRCNHYRIKPDATWDPEEPRVASAFHYQLSMVVGPQKTGKGPWAATTLAVEGLGPTVFIGWAVGGEKYRCVDHGCECGWTYTYEAGEPMGMPRPTPLIQLTANSKEQTDNTYRPLKSMFRNGFMTDTARTGEEFIRLPDDGEIATVTSSARGRLGNPVTFVLWDEVGLYTTSNGMVNVYDTQARGLAGMDARGLLTTNCWDRAEQSVAQMVHESETDDTFVFYQPPPPQWSYRNKEERRKIHRYVYAGSPWVNLDTIESLAFRLLQRDPAQAERFFGNRLVAHQGAWLPEGSWTAQCVARPAPPGGTSICLGFDGSLNNDWTAIRCRTVDGWGFTPVYGPDRRPTYWNPAEWGGEIPRGEVRAAIDELYTSYDVERGYFDPEDWESEIDGWALKYGEKRVLYWRTNRITPMYEALRRFEADLATGAYTHDDCRQTEIHMANARKVAKAGQKYILGKSNEHQKIDLAMSDVLAHEAAADARVDGWGVKKTYWAYTG